MLLDIAVDMCNVGEIEHFNDENSHGNNFSDACCDGYAFWFINEVLTYISEFNIYSPDSMIIHLYFV